MSVHYLTNDEASKWRNLQENVLVCWSTWGQWQWYISRQFCLPVTSLGDAQKLLSRFKICCLSIYAARQVHKHEAAFYETWRKTEFRRTRSYTESSWAGSLPELRVFVSFRAHRKHLRITLNHIRHRTIMTVFICLRDSVWTLKSLVISWTEERLGGAVHDVKGLIESLFVVQISCSGALLSRRTAVQGAQRHQSFSRMMQGMSEQARRIDVVNTVLEVRRYGPVWHTGTSLPTWKKYRHCFSGCQFTLFVF